MEAVGVMVFSLPSHLGDKVLHQIEEEGRAEQNGDDQRNLVEVFVGLKTVQDDGGRVEPDGI